MGSNDAEIQEAAGRIATTAYITLTAPAPHGRQDVREVSGPRNARVAAGWYSTTTGR